MEEDAGVKELRDAVESAQRAMMDAAAKGDDVLYARQKKVYEQNKKDYLAHPLVQNMESASEELHAELSAVVGELS